MSKTKALAYVSTTCDELAQAKEARVRAFKLAHEEGGCTLREIAVAAGMSHVGVLTEIRRHDAAERGTKERTP